MPPNDRPPTPPPAPPRRGNPLIPAGWIALAVLVVIAAVYFMADPTREIKYSEFTELVDAGQVKSIVLVGSDRAEGEVRDPNSDAVQKLDPKLKGGKFRVILPTVENQ